MNRVTKLNIYHSLDTEIAFSERCPPVPQELVSDSRMPETLNPFLAFSSEDLKVDNIFTVIKLDLKTNVLIRFCGISQIF
jgi:hypothetical protein